MIASIVVHGGPDGGGKARRGCLAAPSAAASAFLNFNPVERGFRAIFPDAFFDGRRLAASGHTSRSRKLQVQPPISFLGSARIHRPSRCIHASEARSDSRRKAQKGGQHERD